MQDKIARSFRHKIKNFEFTRKRIEDLYSKKFIVGRDLQTLYEGLFLRLVTSFESFLEDLFLQIMLGKTCYPKSRVKPRVEFRSITVLREVLLQTHDYLEWLPYQKTLNRANSYLRGGRPFSQLTDAQISKIREAIRVRNSVAHSSEYSKIIFEKKVLGNLILSPRERTPAGFLRSTVRINPPLCRFQLYLSNFSRISHDLTK
jgi:hypothetical protein